MADLKLDTLIKVLLMTTSDNNSEALAAIRRANHLLKVANVDWEKLLKGKVTVVADPFADIAPPSTETHFGTSKPTVPPKPQVYDDPPLRPAPTYPRTATRPMGPATPRAPSYSPQAARKNNTNTYAGHCYSCDDAVAAGYGALRDVMGKTHVFCEDCNFKISNGSLPISSVVARANARKQQQQASSYTPRVKRKVTTKDLMSDIFDNKGQTT